MVVSGMLPPPPPLTKLTISPDTRCQAEIRSTYSAVALLYSGLLGEDGRISGPSKTRTVYFPSLTKVFRRCSTIEFTELLSCPSTAITSPRGDEGSRKLGVRGGEILARTFILLRNGIVITVVSTSDSSCGNEVTGVAAFVGPLPVVCNGGSLIPGF